MPLLEAGPAASSSWSVSLSASDTGLDVGEPVTLTATVNQSVTGSGYYIDIFDQTTGMGVGFCSTGSTCQVTHTESQSGSHTFVAFVDGDPVFHYPPCCIQATSNTVTVEWNERATAAFDVGFAVSGTLPNFPCPTGCLTSFNGAGTGSGSAQADVAGAAYNATFAVPSGAVTGSAVYTEPDPPLCPAIGSAAGSVSLTGAAVGAVYRSSTPAEVGKVTSVTFTLDFTYVRGGPASLIIVTGGRAVLSYSFPTDSGSFVSDVTGAGPGLFEVDPTAAATRCSAPGPIGFTVVGDVGLTLTE